MKSVEDTFCSFRVRCFLCQFIVKKDITGLAFNVCDSISSVITHLNNVCAVFFGQRFNLLLSLVSDFLELNEIDFCQNEDERFALKEWFD